MTPELTLAIATELARLYPDEYGKPERKPYYSYDKENRTVIESEDKLIVMVNGKPFTLDDGTCWVLFVRFAGGINRHIFRKTWNQKIMNNTECNIAIKDFYYKLTKQSFAEMLLETLRGM